MTEQHSIDVETPYESAEAALMPPHRQGKLFLNLCDMRVATVATNALNIVIICIGFLVHLIKYFGLMPVEVAIPALVLSSIGIFGAVNFELWAVAMAALGYFAGLLIDLWWLNLFGAIFGCLVLYPTTTLAYEIYQGIMTPAAYQEREEFIDFDMLERAGIKKTYLTKFHETFPQVHETLGAPPAETK